MGAPSACETAGVPNVSYNGSTASTCPDTFIVSSRIDWVPYFEYMIDQTLAIKNARDAAQAAAEEAAEAAGEEIEFDRTTVDISEYAIATDWTGTIATGSVVLTEFGSAAAEGTAEKVAEVQAQLEAGTLHVFDCSKFTVTKTDTLNANATVDAEGHLTGYMADVNTDDNYTPDTEVVSDGYFHESEHRSAPYFDVRIDGITELASAS